jgi:hypothetical protein
MKGSIEDKKYDKQFGLARLFFLILHLLAILHNLQDQVALLPHRLITSFSISQRLIPHILLIAFK